MSKITNMEKQHQKGKFTLLPIPQHLEKSMSKMTAQQIQLNIIQIFLASTTNKHILQNLIIWMKQPHFYHQYRYLLPNILIDCKDQKYKNKIKQILQKFDSAYVNGQINTNQIKIQQLQHNLQMKSQKAYLISLKQNIFDYLNNLSNQLFKNSDQQIKRQLLIKQISVINKMLLQLSFKKIDIKKDKKTNQQQNQQKYGIPIKYYNKWCMINHINQSDSLYFQTKNRNPLLLDLQFGRFLYKNDNQLSHELISMEIINYLNRIIPIPLIIQFGIYPQKIGALYQFVQRSLTVSSIKKTIQNEFQLVEYMQLLETLEINKGKNVKKKFAQSYAGFCFAQFVLEIKDRNNQNIMIRQDGSIFHIDLTFIFESKPGGILFQTAPFKMTKQYIQILGGYESDNFKYFQSLLIQCFTCFYLHQDQFFFKLNQLAKHKQIKCFQGFRINRYRKKFPSKVQQVRRIVQELIDQSQDNWKTNKYDSYQQRANNIIC